MTVEEALAASKLLKVEFRIVTPEEAADLLEHQTSNRVVRRNRVVMYARDIADGKWAITGNSMIIISDRGTMMNGQHTCLAILKANKAIVTLVVSGVPLKYLPTIDQGASRSMADVIFMEGASNTAAAASIARMLQQIEVWGMITRDSPPRSQIVACYKKNKDEINDAIGAARITVAKPLRFPMGPTAMAYILISRAGGKADKFLKAVVDDDGSDAVKALRRYMARTSHRLAGRILPILIKAYNAWANGDNINILTYRLDESFPEVVTNSRRK